MTVPSIGTSFRGPEGKPGYLLRQAFQLFRAVMETNLKETGITASQYSLLSVVEFEPGLSGAQLAKAAVMTEQSVGELIVTLEKAGWIERRRTDSDRRVRRIYLTETGRESVAASTPVVRAIENRMLGGLTEDKQREFRSLLSQAAANLVGLPAATTDPDVADPSLR